MARTMFTIVQLFKLSVMQGNERRGSRRLQCRWSEIDDILKRSDIPIFRRLGDLGSIVSSPVFVWPGGRAPSANANAFWHILGTAGRIQDLKGRRDLGDKSLPCSGSRD